jgi:pilus assembly protein CpaE
MAKTDAIIADQMNLEGRTRLNPARVLCISPSRSVLNELSTVLSVAMPGVAAVELTAYPDAAELRRAFGAHAPSLVFLDVTSDQPRALSLIPEAVKIDAAVSIIALLAGNEPQLILRCLRQGAAEFVLQPFTAAQIEAALVKVARTVPKEGPPPRDTAKVYCVMPAKGACGASTLASNLAYQCKRSGKSRVLLADMDPFTGTISFLLKVKSSYSFVDVLHREDELDADLWKAMVSQRQGVDVLLAPENLFDGANDLRDATAVINYARQNYDVVVLDAPQVYGEWSLSQARLSDEIILVTTNELAALQATQRALSYLEAQKIGRSKIRVVVNRYDKDVGVSRDVIGTALQAEIFHVIPSDYDAIQKFLLEGKAAPMSASLGKSFATLADLLGGGAKKAGKSGSPLGGLLSLFSRTSA